MSIMGGWAMIVISVVGIIVSILVMLKTTKIFYRQRRELLERIESE